MTANVTAAWQYVSSLKIRSHRRYAERVLAWYRDQGTGREINPEFAATGLSSVAHNRIHNTIRYHMVGDTDPQGYRIDAVGKRI